MRLGLPDLSHQSRWQHLHFRCKILAIMVVLLPGVFGNRLHDGKLHWCGVVRPDQSMALDVVADVVVLAFRVGIRSGE